MSDQQNPPPDPAPDPTGADPVESVTDVTALRREAAARRVKLRETEAERDALRQRVDRQDRAAIEGMVAERFNDASDFWQATSLDDLRDADGTVDVGRAEAAVTALLAAKPHYAKAPAEPPPPTPGPQTPTVYNGPRQTQEKGPSFGEEIKRSAGLIR